MVCDPHTPEYAAGLFLLSRVLSPAFSAAQQRQHLVVPASSDVGSVHGVLTVMRDGFQKSIGHFDSGMAAGICDVDPGSCVCWQCGGIWCHRFYAAKHRQPEWSVLWFPLYRAVQSIGRGEIGNEDKAGYHRHPAEFPMPGRRINPSGHAASSDPDVPVAVCTAADLFHLPLDDDGYTERAAGVYCHAEDERTDLCDPSGSHPGAQQPAGSGWIDRPSESDAVFPDLSGFDRSVATALHLIGKARLQISEIFDVI